MVVGIVIGSGVFFKADDVLAASGGRLLTSLAAWLIGGSIMVVTAYVFSHIATRIGKVNGVVDYFEEAYGKKAGYLVAWFMTFIYYPTLVAVLAWVSANYTQALFGLENAVWYISMVYLVLFFLLNIFAPVLAGKWQVSTTVIKLIPLGLVAVIGMFKGVTSGQLMDSFSVGAKAVANSGGLAVATLSTAFAYEGWIIATSINAELKDAKKTLPKALVVGTLVVVAVYMFYYLGIAGVLGNDEVLKAGDAAPVQVISLIFGKFSATLLSVFVIISCLGTLNGLVMGCSRGMYSIASRDMGPAAPLFKTINPKTDTAMASALLGFVLSCLWMVVWYGNFHGWWGGFMDVSELPIAFLYVIYISLYMWVIKNFRDLPPFSRFMAPALAGCGSIYIIWGAIHKAMFIPFLIISLVILGLGMLLRK
ncbi:MAG: APC family permease [Desulfovibrionales bacterium]|nr:APC family permease [Desulfovibrionales bacterium]